MLATLALGLCSAMRERLALGSQLLLQEQAALLSELALQNPMVGRILDAVHDWPDAWLGAGIVVQPVWNMLSGQPAHAHLQDIDVLYWEADVSWEAENRRIRELERRVGATPWPLDVKNVARVHLWYQEKFGVELAPLPSVAASVATWPVRASCVALGRRDGEVELCAPYGLQDLFAQRLRPNRVLDIAEVYRRKVERWSANWPALEVLPW